jgi:diaminopimelate epimerase
VTSGGVGLTVQFSDGKRDGVDQVFLKGPAHLIYRGELTEEALIE